VLSIILVRSRIQRFMKWHHKNRLPTMRRSLERTTISTSRGTLGV